MKLPCAKPISSSAKEKVPYFVPCFDEKSCYILLAFLPRLLHLAAHFHAERSCTRTDLFPVNNACWEYEVDTLVHLSESMLHTCVSLSRFKAQPTIAWCASFMTGVISICVFTHVFLFDASLSPLRPPHGILLTTGDTATTDHLRNVPAFPILLICGLWGHQWATTAFTHDLRLANAIFAIFLAPSYLVGAFVGNMSAVLPVLYALDLLVLLSVAGNNRMTWKDTLFYWSCKLSGPSLATSIPSSSSSYSSQKGSMKLQKHLD